ncbi:CAP domain-containing protein [Algoriphagus machipongonensis]|uniref:SCP domain-containing protein n=1 Tax=Algoriphagus machipongonensis TaxID=388413 RepID=A3HU02_9BACT|nr:CAP domain-containing protein [Algoriphagus machipongonensis]EAZ81624.1 hypothetical protein ALPR1_00245 [Algoriphagus machipongonensis]
MNIYQEIAIPLIRVYLTLVSLCLPSLLFAQNWSEKDYERYTIAEFYELDAIYQPIDFEHIDRPLLHAAIFYVTNEMRQKRRLPLFKHLPTAEKVAKDHADDMVKYDFYSHYSKVPGKKFLTDRMKLEGMDPYCYAENISSSNGLQYEYGRRVNPPGPKGVFTYASRSRKEEIVPHTYISFARSVLILWMNSRTHKNNIISTCYQYLGCAAAYYGDDTFYDMPNFISVQCFSSEQK